MAEIGLLQFPLHEIQKRMALIGRILSEIGKRTVNERTDYSIHLSRQPETDFEIMKRAKHRIEVPVIDAILAEFPDDSCFSEGIQANHSGEFTWWIDPLDGARNFLHGQPLFALSAGICFREEPVAGTVVVPMFGETYTAIRGNGAYKNGTPIRVSTVSSIERSLISTGFPYRRNEFLYELIGEISAFISNGIGLRRTGSVILDLCWLAEGRLDAMWERGVKPWDICAASVILGEAEGEISGFEGEPFSLFLGDVLATNRLIHKRAGEILHRKRNVEQSN